MSYFSLIIGLIQMSVFPQNLCVKTMTSNVVAFADLERLLNRVYGAFRSGISGSESTVRKTIHELNGYPATIQSIVFCESRQSTT